MMEVAGPLAEAADYERLQLVRRRGVVCLLLAGWALAASLWMLDIESSFSVPFGFAATIGMFVVVLVVRGYLRKKLEWRELFGQYQAGEPRLWHLALFAAAALALAFASPALFVASWDYFDALLAVAVAMVAFASGFRARDWALFHIGWAPLLIGLLVTLRLIPGDLWLFKGALVLAALAIPTLSLALVRLVAPRRWLIQ